MEHLLNLTTVGLAYDGFGVIVLGTAFFRTGVSTLYLNSRSFYMGNDGVFEDSVAGKTDGITGTVLLGFGFLLQLFGAAKVQQTFIAGVFLVLLAALLVGYVLFMRKRAIGYQLRKGEEFKERWEKGSDEDS